MKYDIFISYRRDGGEYTAKIIHDKLTTLGYRVFFDVESLRSGQFNEKLLSVIEECSDFILVLSPNSLNRCVNEDDWVRLEIAHAFKSDKNVIPVMLRGFEFPLDLPYDIEKIRFQNGVEASTEFFDAFAVKLLKFLRKKPRVINRIIQNEVLRKMFPALIAFLIVFTITITVAIGYKKYQEGFPVNKAEKNTVSEVIYYVSTNLTQANIAMENYESALDEIENYIEIGDESKKELLISNLINYQNCIMSADEDLTSLDESLSDKIDRTPLPKDDIVALESFLDTTLKNYVSNISFIYNVIDQNSLSSATIKEVVKFYREYFNQEDDILYYGLNEMFLSVNDNALKDLRSSVLPELSKIYTGQNWLSDEDELEALQNAAITKQEEALSDYMVLIGNENAAIEKAQQTIEDLEKNEDELNKLYDEAREKFKPLDTDTPDLLWGKMLRYNSLSMYDMCIECIQKYQLKATDQEAATIYVPIAIQFFNQIGNTGIDYGVMVVGFEDDINKHSFYEMGDIIISLNKTQVKNTDDLNDIVSGLSDDEIREVQVLRYDGENFQIISGTYSADNKKIRLLDMSEE